MAEVEEKIPTIAEDIVVTKYKMAADIVNRKCIQNFGFSQISLMHNFINDGFKTFKIVLMFTLTTLWSHNSHL